MSDFKVEMLWPRCQRRGKNNSASESDISDPKVEFVLLRCQRLGKQFDLIIGYHRFQSRFIFALSIPARQKQFDLGIGHYRFQSRIFLALTLAPRQRQFDFGIGGILFQNRIGVATRLWNARPPASKPNCFCIGFGPKAKTIRLWSRTFPIPLSFWVVLLLCFYRRFLFSPCFLGPLLF